MCKGPLVLHVTTLHLSCLTSLKYTADDFFPLIAMSQNFPEYVSLQTNYEKNIFDFLINELKDICNIYTVNINKR